MKINTIPSTIKLPIEGLGNCPPKEEINKVFQILNEVIDVEIVDIPTEEGKWINDAYTLVFKATERNDEGQFFKGLTCGGTFFTLRPRGCEMKGISKKEALIKIYWEE